MYGAELIFRSFATFFGETIFDQVTNKGFALLAAGQFATRLQEFGLRVPSLMAADKPCTQLQPSLALRFEVGI